MKFLDVMVQKLELTERKWGETRNEIEDVYKKWVLSVKLSVVSGALLCWFELLISPSASWRMWSFNKAAFGESSFDDSLHTGPENGVFTSRTRGEVRRVVERVWGIAE